MLEYIVYFVNGMESVFMMNSKIFGDSTFCDDSIVKFKFDNTNIELNIEDCELEEIEPDELLLRAEKVFEIKNVCLNNKNCEKWGNLNHFSVCKRNVYSIFVILT